MTGLYDKKNHGLVNKYHLQNQIQQPEVHRASLHVADLRKKERKKEEKRSDKTVIQN